MRTAIVCSYSEWQKFRADVMRFLRENGENAAYLYLTDDVLPEQAEYPAEKLAALSEDTAERVVFLSLYDFSAALAVFRTGCRNVDLLHREGFFLHGAGEALAVQKEQQYLADRNYPALKQLNRIRMLLSYFHRETVLQSYPIDLQIESTSYCNAECIMCGHFVYHNAIARHMPPELAGQLRTCLMYAENVILHGNGEPFLQPQIAEIIRYYGSFGVRVVTNTNLSVLNEELIDCMKQYFSEITVSIDGCTKEIYEGIRRNLRFETLLRHIDMLNTALPELPKKIAVVAARQNLHQLPDFIPFAKAHGFCGVTFIALGSSEVAQNQMDEPQQYPETASAQLRKAAALAAQYGIAVEMPIHLILPHEPDPAALEAERLAMQAYPMFPDSARSQALFDTYVKPRLEALQKEAAEPICFSDYTAAPLTEQAAAEPLNGASCCGICDSVMMRPYIMLEGKVSTCCLRQKSYLGSMTGSRSLGTLWNHPSIQALREQFFNGSIPAYCAGCSFMNNHFLKLGSFQTGNRGDDA